MTFILGVGHNRLTYDYFGDWINQQDLAAEAHGVIGDPSWPGECSPGTFMPGEELQDMRIETEAA